MAKKANSKKKMTKGQAMSHSTRLNQALKSLSVSGTQLNSILPVQRTVEYPESSAKVRGRATKKSDQGTKPVQKLLLQVSDPGKAPTAPKAPEQPKAPTNPYTIPKSKPTTTYQDRLAEIETKLKATKNKEEQASLEKEAKATKEAISEITNSKDKTVSAQVAEYTRYTSKVLPRYQQDYQAYQTNLRDFNDRTLPNYNIAKSQFDSAQRTNTQRKTQYKREMAKFMNAQTRKGKTVSKSRTTRSSRGSR